MPIPDQAAITAALDAMFNGNVPAYVSPAKVAAACEAAGHSVKKMAEPKKKGPNWCNHCEVNHHKNTNCPWKKSQDNGGATPEPPPAAVKQGPPQGTFTPDPDKTLAGALNATGLWSTSVAGKGLQILSESGGTPMTVEEIVSKGNLVLPASYAVSIDKVLKAKLTQLVSSGYVKKINDGYIWAGKWDSPAGTSDEASATPMPQHKPAEPAAAAPTPQAKALKDFIGQIKDSSSFAANPEDSADIIKVLPSMATLSPLDAMYAIRNILQAGDPGNLPGGGFPLAKEIYDQLTMKGVLKATGPQTHQVNLDAMPANPWDVAEAFDDKPALSSIITQPLNAGNKTLTPQQKAHVAQALAKVFKADASPTGLVILKALKDSSPEFGLAQGKYLLEALQADGILVSQGDTDSVLGSHINMADAPTGKCPDGHATFKTPVPHNCPSCGKVMQPQAAANADTQPQNGLMSKLTEAFPTAYGSEITALSNVLQAIKESPNGKHLDFIVDALSGAAMQGADPHEWIGSLKDNDLITVDSDGMCHVVEGTQQTPAQLTQDHPAAKAIKDKLVADNVFYDGVDVGAVGAGLANFTKPLSKQDLEALFMAQGLDADYAASYTGMLFQEGIISKVPGTNTYELGSVYKMLKDSAQPGTAPAQTPVAHPAALAFKNKLVEDGLFSEDGDAPAMGAALATFDSPLPKASISTLLKDHGIDSNSADAYVASLIQDAVITKVPGSNTYELGPYYKSLKEAVTPDPSPQQTPVVPPTPQTTALSVQVPDEAQVATTLGWNPTGKGLGLLKALNTAGDAGQTLDEAVQTFATQTGSPPPAKGLAAKILDAAIEKGFVKRIPGTKPPKWLFATGLPASAIVNVPPPPTAKPAFVPGQPKPISQAASEQLAPLGLNPQETSDAIACIQTGNPIQNLQNSGMPQEKVFEISQALLQCGLLTPGPYWPLPISMSQNVAPSGQCPNGHTTYKNPVPDACPSCGTPMNGSANTPAGASTIPKTIDQIPDGKTLQLIGDAHGQVGGIKEKEFYKDPATGQKYLFKPDTDGYHKFIRPASAEACAAIGAAILGTDAVIPVKADVNAQGVPGSFQPWHTAKGDANILNMKALTPAQKSQLQNERVFDWVTANHDTKKENFIVLQDGRIVGIDKEQGFKWVGQDKLSTSYKPNQGVPIYNELYKDYAAKKIDLNPMDIKPALDKLDAIPDSTYLAMIEPYVAANAKEFGWSEAQKEVKRQAILTRKHEARADLEKFYNELRAMRGEPPISFGLSLTPHHAQIISNILPPLGSMKKAGSAAAMGGAKKDKIYVVSKLDGGKFLFKPAKEQFRAYVQQVVSDLSRYICTIDRDFAVVQAGCLADGTLGAMQTLLPKKANLKGTSLKKLSKTQLADLQAERVLDWAVSNHDSHGNNLIFLQNGMIAGVDKEQAFKYLGSDKLSLSYHPNKTYMEEAPVYNELYSLYASKQIHLNPNDCLPSIQNIEKTADSIWMDIVEPYVISVAKAGKARCALRAAILARKHSIRSDFRNFFTVLNAMRGEQGPFTFADETT